MFELSEPAIEPMEIHVKGYLTFRSLVGARRLILDQQTLTLWELVENLADEIGAEFAAGVLEPGKCSVRRHVAILVNGMHYNHLPDKINTLLKDGDEVAIFPPVAGGSG